MLLFLFVCFFVFRVDTPFMYSYLAQTSCCTLVLQNLAPPWHQFCQRNLKNCLKKYLFEKLFSFWSSCLMILVSPSTLLTGGGMPDKLVSSRKLFTRNLINQHWLGNPYFIILTKCQRGIMAQNIPQMRNKQTRKSCEFK